MAPSRWRQTPSTALLSAAATRLSLTTASRTPLLVKSRGSAPASERLRTSGAGQIIAWPVLFSASQPQGYQLKKERYKEKRRTRVGRAELVLSPTASLLRS